MSTDEPPVLPEPTEPTETAESAEAPVEGVAEPAAEPDPVAAKGNGTRNLKIAIVALAVLSLGLALVAGNLSSRNRDLKAKTEDVTRAAAAMGSALLTYDYKDLPKTKALVLKLATGAFEKQYSAAFEGGLDTVLTNSKAVSSVRDINVFISDVMDSDASAIVVIDTVVSGTAGSNRRLTSYIRLDLVKTDEGWLVDGVTNLNLGLPSDGTGATTSTTTANVTTTTR